MTKRRRERDKPKAGPEALYNPNKRVLLSYASDEDDGGEEMLPPAEELVAMRASTIGANDAADVEEDELEEEDVEVQGDVSNYQMTEYPDEDLEGEVDGGQAGGEGVEIEQEEEEEVPVDDWATRKKRDPTTNQFPSLGPPPPDDEDEDEEYDPETEEAMAYLRAVRSERQTIPDILSATHQMQADADQIEGAGESSLPTPPAASDTTPRLETGSNQHDKTDPQKVFTRRLLDRFYLQRSHLHIPPTSSQLATLTSDHLISFPEDNIKAFHEWQRILSTTPPIITQLRCMDEDTVINLLGVIQRHHVAKNHEITVVTSAWIWALLTRLDDVGTMTNDQVYPLRELGKKALLVLLHQKSPAVAEQLEATLGVKVESPPRAEIGDAQATASADSTENLSVAEPAAVEEAPAASAMASENTLATLDMILVLVGEVFGQKDLLECRLPWSSNASATAPE